MEGRAPCPPEASRRRCLPVMCVCPNQDVPGTVGNTEPGGRASPRVSGRRESIGSFLEEPDGSRVLQDKRGRPLQEEGTSCPKTKLWKGEQQRVTECGRGHKRRTGWPRRSSPSGRGPAILLGGRQSRRGCQERDWLSGEAAVLGADSASKEQGQRQLGG